MGSRKRVTSMSWFKKGKRYQLEDLFQALEEKSLEKVQNILTAKPELLS